MYRSQICGLANVDYSSSAFILSDPRLMRHILLNIKPHLSDREIQQSFNISNVDFCSLQIHTFINKYAIFLEMH